ncbi:MAG: hypothetical protein GXO54_03350 [Chloroflexi bacterium]|nr:hypothetical protein [Chloroflexota bacterium]
MYDFRVFVVQHRRPDRPGPALVVWGGRAPRSATRHRRREALLLLLHFEGEAIPSLQAQEAWADELAQVYFARSGPVTGALQALADRLDARLQRANRHLARRGQRVRASLAAWVWRDRSVYAAFAGPWHVYRPVVGSEVPLAQDPGPGLGEGTALVALARWSADEGPWVVSHGPLPAQVDWDAIARDPEQGLTQMLDAAASSEQPIVAAWIEATPGVGELTRTLIQRPWRVSARPSPTRPAEGAPPTSATAPSALPSSRTTTQPAASTSLRSAAPERAETVPSPDVAPSPGARTHAEATRAGSRTRPTAQPWRRWVARALLLPWPRVPTRWLFFLALAVPVMVVAAALAVYIHQGRLERRAYWAAQAQAALAQAQHAGDPLTQRDAWARALHALNLALSYGYDPDLARQRDAVRAALDRLDGTVRLPFQPVLVGSYGNRVRFEKLALGLQDLYVLEAKRQQIWRFQWTGGALAFEPDSEFRCRKEQLGTLTLDTFVGLAAFPPARFPFQTLAIDRAGHGLMCAPGELPQAHMLPEPRQGWGTIRLAKVADDRLYVLTRRVNPEHPEQPEDILYLLDLKRLTNTVPQVLFRQANPIDLANVVDFAVLRGEIYFLFVDTQVARCQLFTTEGPKCEALTYQDPRPGRQDGPVMTEARFRYIHASAIPEPSLYLFDPEQQAVYHFSLRLRFDRQYRPPEPLEAEFTHFAVGLDPSGASTLFLLSTNQVYAAPLP